MKTSAAAVGLWLVGVAWLLQADGCGGSLSGRDFTEGREPTPEIVSACELTARRCSRCHPLERPLIAHVTRPANWVWYVDRMRHQPESGISEDEARIIVRCLVFHSFGPEGLASFSKDTGAQALPEGTQ